MPAKLKRRLFIFIALVLLVAAAFFAHWYFVGRYYEHTDNAYVQGEITRVSSQLQSLRREIRPVQGTRGLRQGDREGFFRLQCEECFF